MQFTTFALAALSLGSAIAVPVVGDLPAYTDALTIVGNVQAIVDKQVNVITTLTKATPVGDSVTQIEASLLTIGQNVNVLLQPLLVLASNPTNTPLSAKQLASVPQLVSSCQDIVESVQTVGKTVVGGVPQDVLNKVQPELQWVLSTVGPVVKPLISLTTTLVPVTSSVYDEINPTLSNIQGIANNLVIGRLNGLVGGVL